MSAIKVQLLGLISLRALAEWDPIEYRRVSDLSKRELNQRIDSLLRDEQDAECVSLREKLVDLTQSSEVATEADLLLQQIYLTSLQQSRYEALEDEKEQRSSLAAGDKAAASRPLPSAIIEMKIADSGLRWSDSGKKRTKKIRDALDASVAEDQMPGVFFECLEEVLNSLAHKRMLVGGPERRKKAVVGECCREILALAGWKLADEVSPDRLWEEASKGDVGGLLRDNVYPAENSSGKKSRAKKRSSKHRSR